MNKHSYFLRSESTSGGGNWNIKVLAAADEIDKLSSLVRECRLALSELLEKRPMQAAMLCGSTTLGNLLVDLNRAVNGMTPNANVTGLAPAQENDK